MGRALQRALIQEGAGQVQAAELGSVCFNPRGGGTDEENSPGEGRTATLPEEGRTATPPGKDKRPPVQPGSHRTPTALSAGFSASLFRPERSPGLGVGSSLSASASR